MSNINELIEDLEQDMKIVKSFKPKDTLCPMIFDIDNNSLKKDIKKKLLEVTKEFLDFVGIEFFIYDIRLTGSLANYNWSKYSDVDLHIVIDFEESTHNSELLKSFFDAKKNNWNKLHAITIKNHDLEVYVQDVDEPHQSSGVYSVLNDEWLVEPSNTEHKIDKKKIIEKAEEFIKIIDDLNEKSEDGQDVRQPIDDLNKKIKKFRQSGLERGGEYSYENLTFKLLRRNGYMGKLLDLKNTQIDKKLSLPQ